MPANVRPTRFLATIYRIWMMRHADVPEEVSRTLAKEMGRGGRAGSGRKRPGPGKGPRQVAPKYIPVVAIVNGKSSRTTQVPAGGGRYRLQINTTLRKAAHADVGDVIGVELRLDRGSRALPVPPDLQTALKTRPQARRVFELMGPGTRRQLLMYLAGAKSPPVRQKRIARFIEILVERAILRPRKRQ